MEKPPVGIWYNHKVDNKINIEDKRHDGMA